MAGRSAEEILQQAAAAVSAALADLPRRWLLAPPRLIESMQYSLLAGGKRLRPALLLESCRACGGDDSSADAINAAVAMELVHTFSLVHDDLPAMDDDDLRRGRPTNHKVFGEAMGILAGDAMLSEAFGLLACVKDATIARRLIRQLSIATGPSGMIGGQAIDIESESTSLDLRQLRDLHGKKTGALIVASVRMGAIVAQADEETLEALDHFAHRIGIAFQIADDLLDVTATAEQLGKAAGKDADRGKNTYPALLGVAGAREQADRELSSALRMIAPLGDRGEGLATLARFVIERGR